MADGSTINLHVSSLGALRKRCWEKDYFTSALPWAQRGPQVQLPITNSKTAPVTLKNGPVQSGQGLFRSGNGASGDPGTGAVTLGGTSSTPLS